MKVKKVTGTYLEIHEGFRKLTDLTFDLENIGVKKVKTAIGLDIGRTPFLGNAFDKFKDKSLEYEGENYVQGDMAGSAQFSITLYTMLMGPEKLGSIFNNQLAYINNNDERAGTFFLAEKYNEHLNTDPNPKCWIMSHTANSDAPLKDREVTIYLSEDTFKAYEQYLKDNDIENPFKFEDVSFHEDLKARMNNEEVSHVASKLVTDKGKTNVVMAECWDNITPNQNNDPKDIEKLYLKDVSHKKLDLMNLLHQQLDELDLKASELKYSPDEKAQKDAEVVQGLAEGLRNEFEKFINDPAADAKRFEELVATRVKDTQPKLNQYKSIQRLLVNIISVVGLIVGLYGVAKHGKWKWMYNPKSDVAKKIGEIEKTVEDTFKPKPH